MNPKDMIKPNNSEIRALHQIPSLPMNKGIKKTHPICNTNVLVEDIIAETTPLFKAVKKAEAKILNPHTK